MLASKIVESFSDKFDDVDVYIEETKSKEFELKNSKDFSKGVSIDRGCGIRAIKNNKMVFGYTSLPDEYCVDGIVSDILSSIEFSKDVDAQIISRNFEHLSKGERKDIDLEEDEAKDKLYFMDKIAKEFDKRVVDVKSAGISVFCKKIEIANNHGMCSSDSATQAFASVSVLAEDSIADMGWYSMDSNDLQGLDFEHIARSAASDAVDKLNPISISTNKYSVIFENRVFVQVLSHFFPVFDAYSVINHTTALENRLDSRIFSDKITIKDVKSYDKRPNNMIIDEEGTKREDTVIVENGVLKSFLHNVYTSNKLNMKNTANAKRGSWMNLPKVGPFNFYVEPNGNLSKKQMLNKIDGVYVTEIMGLHMANNISGDFSLGISGFFVHGGKFVSYFKSATLADNFFDLMNRVIDVSNNMYFFSSFGSPDVAVADCVVGGEGK